MATGEEAARLSALHGYGVLDSPNEIEFDLLVREAARGLNAPIALISLVDEHRQWFKARVGIAAQEMPRSISFCTHAIRGNDVMVVEDASRDERFATNPLVTDDPGVRFYAGAPLTTRDGKRIGTLCVIDTRSRRQPTASEKAHLLDLARRTVEAFEKRRP